MVYVIILVVAIAVVALIVYISNNKSKKKTTRYNRADEIQKVYDKLNREYDAEMEKMIAKFSHDLWSDTKTNKSDNIEKNGNTYANNANNDTDKNDHEWVDLGLPSGTKWATCNIGANLPEEYGDYFAWGETVDNKKYSWEKYRHNSQKFWMNLIKYCNNAEYGNDGFTDDLTVLDASDDAATVNWGKGWSVPVKSDFEELKNNCQWKDISIHGVKGFVVTGPNGNSIFLPKAGYHPSENELYAGIGSYWSASLNTARPYESWSFYLSVSGPGSCISRSRIAGLSIRPVTH